MTLLELLVKELPARGGWPKYADVAFQDDDREVRFMSPKIDCSTASDFIASELCSGDGNDKPDAKGIRHAGPVTREQYEAASEWNGEGLPPVGIECEWIKHSPNTAPLWRKGVIQYLSACTVVIKNYDPGEIVGHPRNFQFRPIRTEADYKREEAVNKIQSHAHVNLVGPISSGQAIALYDAITAHKIPGVTTVPNVGEIMRATESCSREDAQKIVDLLNGA